MTLAMQICAVFWIAAIINVCVFAVAAHRACTKGVGLEKMAAACAFKKQGAMLRWWWLSVLLSMAALFGSFPALCHPWAVLAGIFPAAGTGLLIADLFAVRMRLAAAVGAAGNGSRGLHPEAKKRIDADKNHPLAGIDLAEDGKSVMR